MTPNQPDALTEKPAGAEAGLNSDQPEEDTRTSEEKAAAVRAFAKEAETIDVINVGVKRPTMTERQDDYRAKNRKVAEFTHREQKDNV